MKNLNKLSVFVIMLTMHITVWTQDAYLWTWGSSLFNLYNMDNYYTNNVANPWPYNYKAPVPIIFEAAEWQSFSNIGSYYSGVRADGTLWAWMHHTNSMRAPVLTQHGTETDWKSVVEGSSRYALKNDGTLWDITAGSGLNYSPTGSYTGTPQQVGTDNDWVSIDRGNSALFALKSDGTLWRWGISGGSLGNITQVGIGDTWTAFNSAFGIKTDGTLWRWTSLTTMSQEGADNDWQKVFAKGSNVYAIKNDGTLWAQGISNTYGQLGLGHTSSVSTLTQVGTDTDWSYISIGTHHCYGLKQDGTLFAWGRNQRHQLGDGTNVNKSTPVQIGNNGEWSMVLAAEDAGVGLRSWGYDSSGGSGEPVSISSAEADPLQIAVYPNPAKETVIVSDLPVGSMLNIKDITGKTIYGSAVTNEELFINTADFVNGIYIIRVTNKGIIVNKKLVINK